ncbi:hypothetical protein [Pontibacter harenae]|uniref:hypothetical protein n=1 Tax=Pontibacter harenae TaxID=2894083 RepID=UPI001E490B8B|nr:hypothetical protein [Pontibacter harenae]MCC9166450.1 hypothetical protein [Pontibacter harenae]
MSQAPKRITYSCASLFYQVKDSIFRLGGIGIVLLSIFFLVACKDTNEGPLIPDVLVNEQINVSSLQYPALRQDGGYVYLNGGYKGIMVVRQSASLYLAVERACPYDPLNTCKLEADVSNLFIIDPCCSSQFNFQGQVTAGPAIYNMKQYRTSLAGNILYITN